jgi:hypothetical protein
MENLKKVTRAQWCLFALLIGFAFLMQNCTEDDALIYEENQIKTELNAKPVSGKVDVCRYNERKGTYSVVSVVAKRVLPGDVYYGQDGDSDGYYRMSGCPELGNPSGEGYWDCDDTNNAITTTTDFYRDADNDTFGDPYNSYEACVVPEGYVANNTDCDDTENTAYPGAAEICGDNKDNNCDGTIDEGCNVEQTYVPDDNFEAYLETNGMGNGTDNDGYVLTANINTVTGLYVSGINIYDLTGIEDFAALQILNCAGNNLSSIDLSQNFELIQVVCANNDLASIDVSNNANLDNMDCNNNLLKTLDLSANTALTYLACTGNQLSSLDLSNNTSLLDLQCNLNGLENLNISGCTALETLYCNDNLLYGSLNISSNTNLIELDCSNNQLESLDLSLNSFLEIIYCNNNLLKDLDVSYNPALINFNCRNNLLTSLIVSSNTNLYYLDCTNNQLTSLNVSNNTKLEYLDCYSNYPSLCIQVNSTQYASPPSGWSKDIDAYYSLNVCS